MIYNAVEVEHTTHCICSFCLQAFQWMSNVLPAVETIHNVSVLFVVVVCVCEVIFLFRFMCMRLFS